MHPTKLALPGLLLAGSLLVGCGGNDATPAKVPNAAPATAKAKTVKADFLLEVRDLGALSPLAPKPRDPEELAAFIRTQQTLLTRNEVLDKVLELKEVKDTQWFHAAAKPAVALRKALTVNVLERSNLIRVSLALADRAEAELVLNKVIDTYLAVADAEARADRDQTLQVFRQAVQAAQKNLDRVRSEADDYRAARDLVVALDPVHNVAANTLGALDLELAQLSIQYALARKEADALTGSQADKEWKPSADILAAVESDPKVVALDKAVMDLERERAVQVQKFGKDHASVREIDAQMVTVAKQLHDVEAARIAQAKAHQRDSALGTVAALEARMAELKKKYDDKRTEIRRTDNDLLGYQRRENVARVAQENVDRATTELNRQEALLTTTLPRLIVRQRAAVPVTEDAAE